MTDDKPVVGRIEFDQVDGFRRLAESENAILRKQLEIAVGALRDLSISGGVTRHGDMCAAYASYALQKIEEMK